MCVLRTNRPMWRVVGEEAGMPVEAAREGLWQELKSSHFTQDAERERVVPQPGR